MTTDAREFVLSCPVCQQEKGLHQLPGGRLQPLEVPAQKWDQIVIDFVTDLPKDEGCNAVLTVVDKAQKWCIFYLAPSRLLARRQPNYSGVQWVVYMGSHQPLFQIGMSALQGLFGKNCGAYWGLVYEWAQHTIPKVQGKLNNITRS